MRLLITALAFVLFGAIGMTQSQATATIAENAPIYVSAVVSQTPLRIAAAGTVLRVLAEETDWIQVEFQDPKWGRRVGWVQRQHVRVSNPELQPMDLSVREDSKNPNAHVAASPAASASTEVTGVLAALKTLRAATEVGMLRTQYSEKLVEVLPSAREFIKGTDGWADLRIAIAHAYDDYKRPMETLESWKYADLAMTAAAMWVDYADTLAKLPDEQNHLERETMEAISVGQDKRGRLGVGDIMMPEKLDRSAAGGFNDIYSFSLSTAARISLRLESHPCTPHLTLVDSTGKKLEGDMGAGGPSTIRKKLPPGTYRIWAGTIAREIGTYTLRLDLEP
jgi:hypothetical protein